MEPLPSRVERFAAAVSSPRTIVAVLGVGVVWAVVNVGLAHAGVGVPDPFPFRWMQRVSLVVNVMLVMMVLRARNARQSRIERANADRARRELAQRVVLDSIIVETMRARSRSRGAARTKH